MSEYFSSEENKVNKIGEDYTMAKLLRYALPGLLTSFFSRIFESLDDGLFVSRYVGQTALAGVKILDPLSSLIFAITHLFAVGASTLSAHKLGEKKPEQAFQIFTKTTVLSIVIGIIFSFVFYIFDDQIIMLLGATEDLVSYAESYLHYYYCFVPFYFLMNCFASYYSVAGKPSMQLFNSILFGILNIVFDIIFIVLMDMGVVGTALSNTISSIIISLIGFVFFANSKHEIHFVAPSGSYLATLRQSFGIANSQMLNSMNFGLTSLATNLTLIGFLGSDGVAAQAIIHDLRRILSSSFIGYASTVGPILAYNFASRNKERLNRILVYNLKIWFYGSLLVMLLGQLCRVPLISIYLSENATQSFYDLTFNGLTIEFFSSPFTSGCIMILRMFVAFKDGKAATKLSIARNFIFRLSCLILIPQLIGASDVWWSFPISEILAFAYSAYIVYINRDNYGYGKSKIAHYIDEKETA